MKSWNRAWLREFVGGRRKEITGGMAVLRMRYGPIVFYLVSSH
jgi:hypothetical protein